MKWVGLALACLVIVVGVAVWQIVNSRKKTALARNQIALDESYHDMMDDESILEQRNRQISK